MSARTEKNAAALEVRRTVVHRAEQMFAKMREIVEQPGSRLQYFQADFYSHDRNYLVATHAMGRYLWVVRESGTELRRIGVSKKDHEWIDAALNQSSEKDVYLVDAVQKTVQSIAEAQARDLLRKMDYEVKGGTVLKWNRPIASFAVDTEHVRGDTYSDVRIGSAPDVKLSEADTVALSIIAQGEVVQVNRSLFAKTRSIRVDGRLIDDLLWPAVTGPEERAFYVGRIHARKEEGKFLESLGIELGDYAGNGGEGHYEVKVSAKAHAELGLYGEAFSWDLSRVSFGLLAPGERKTRVAGGHMSDAEVSNCKAALNIDRIQLAREHEDKPAQRALAEQIARLEAEEKRRAKLQEHSASSDGISFTLRPGEQATPLCLVDKGYGVSVRSTAKGTVYAVARNGNLVEFRQDDSQTTLVKLSGKSPFHALVAVDLREMGLLADPQVSGDLRTVWHYGRIESTPEDDRFLRDLGIELALREPRESFVRVRMRDDVLDLFKTFASEYPSDLHARSEWTWEPAHVADSLKDWEESVLATEFAFADFHRAAGLGLPDPYDGAGVIARDGITPDSVLVRIAAERERAAEALHQVIVPELAAEPALDVM